MSLLPVLHLFLSPMFTDPPPPLGQILPVVFKSHQWSLLHGLLEMFSYRTHHSPPQYCLQLLSNIPHLAVVPLNTISCSTQLHLWSGAASYFLLGYKPWPLYILVDLTCLHSSNSKVQLTWSSADVPSSSAPSLESLTHRLISGLDNIEVDPSVTTRFFSTDAKPSLSSTGNDENNSNILH